MFIRFITTGGTIDKIYFDALSQFEIGDSLVKHILTEGLADFDYEIVPLLQKDSLDMTDEDRATLRDYIAADDADRYVVTHGTDTMTETAAALAGIPDKVIVLTGSMTPAQFRISDAEFNIGCAVGALHGQSPGVYIAMNGRVFPAGAVQKNLERQIFEATDGRNPTP